MALVFLIIPVYILLHLINDYLNKKGRKKIPENIIFPIGLFIVMCIVAYELSFSFLSVVILFFFGYLVGGLTQDFLSTDELNQILNDPTISDHDKIKRIRNKKIYTKTY